MTRSRTSLQAFLAAARAALAAPPSQRPTPLTFVVGNESADLDSLCSAVLLAYMRTHPAAAPSSSTPSPAPGTLHVPLCNIPRADLPLHPEFAAVLRGDAFSGPTGSGPSPSVAGISATDVPTLTDLPGPEALRPADTRWILVDHNVPTGELAARFFPGSGGSGGGGSAILAGCVDHHVDESVVPPDASPRLIETAGSCASLVVELCRREGSFPASEAGSAGSSEEDRLLDAQLARLALAPVLIDTRNLGDASKTTARDEAAVEAAEALLPPLGPGYAREAVFARLSELKNDISAMPMRDVLRKDYKEWVEHAGEGGPELRLGMSSVPQGMGYVAAKATREEGGEAAGESRGRRKAPAAASALGRPLCLWAEERGLDLLALMTASSGAEDGAFRRELLLFLKGKPGEKEAAATKAAEDALRRFLAAHGEALGLETWSGGELDAESGDEGGDWGVRCWSQARVENSRKQVAPMLREAMRQPVGGG